MKTAVCISGIASFVPEYEKVIKQAKKFLGNTISFTNNGKDMINQMYQIVYMFQNQNGTIT